MNKSQSLIRNDFDKKETNFLISVIIRKFCNKFNKNKIGRRFKNKFFNKLI